MAAIAQRSISSWGRVGQFAGGLRDERLHVPRVIRHAVSWLSWR